MSVKGWQGEAKADTKSSTQKAKEGGEMTREEVLKAAEMIKAICVDCLGKACDCPLCDEEENCIVSLEIPAYWHLDEARKRRAVK